MHRILIGNANVTRQLSSAFSDVCETGDSSFCPNQDKTEQVGRGGARPLPAVLAAVSLTLPFCSFQIFRDCGGGVIHIRSYQQERGATLCTRAGIGTAVARIKWRLLQGRHQVRGNAIHLYDGYETCVDRH